MFWQSGSGMSSQNFPKTSGGGQLRFNNGQLQQQFTSPLQTMDSHNGFHYTGGQQYWQNVPGWDSFMQGFGGAPKPAAAPAPAATPSSAFTREMGLTNTQPSATASSLGNPNTGLAQQMQALMALFFGGQ